MEQARELETMPKLGAHFARALLPRFDRGPARVPDTEVLVRDVHQDPDRLAAYDQLCGFDVRNQVPPTWLHVLTFPLHVVGLSSPESSLRLAGVVHVSNQMHLVRPVSVTEVLDIRVGIGNLRPHRRGALLDLVGRIHVGDELVWTGTSTYLAPGASVTGELVAVPHAEFSAAPPLAQWKLSRHLGREYRQVSGDPNPIHTHRLVAKAFGFDRPIIHGMWTHAKLLSAFQARLPEAYSVQVNFAKPILLPGRVGAWWQQDVSGWTAAVTTVDGSKPYLTMRVSH